MLTRVMTIIGELLITAGVLVGGFVVWQQVSEAQLSANQEQHADELLSFWQSNPSLSIEDVAKEFPDLGKGFAILEIPRLGDDWRRIVAEGVGFDVLNDRATGVGHYPGTGMPGEEGNFGISAHRLGNGGPFIDLHKMVPGDEMRVTTGGTTWVYTMVEQLIVKPTAVEVLDAVPGAYEITMTTCHPMYEWHERMIIKGELTEKIENGVVTKYDSVTHSEGA